MNDNIVFFDTNILVYLYTQSELEKKEAIIKLIGLYESLFISTQVINEFINVMLKKHQASYEQVIVALQKEILVQFNLLTVTQVTIQKALAIGDRYKYSYYDSLIIAAALECNASVLFSEDMHDGHTIENSLQIANPLVRSQA